MANSLEEVLDIPIEDGLRGNYGESESESESFLFSIPAIDEYNKRVGQINREIDQEWIDYKNFKPSNAKPYGYFDSSGQWQDATMASNGVWMTPEGGLAMPTTKLSPEKPREYMKPINPITGSRSRGESTTQGLGLSRPPKDFAGEPKAPKLDFYYTGSNGVDMVKLHESNQYPIHPTKVGAVNARDIPVFYGNQTRQGRTMPTLEMKTKDASGRIISQDVPIDQAGSIYFNQTMNVIEQAPYRDLDGDGKKEYDWNNQQYQNKLKEQMGLWGYNYDDVGERNTVHGWMVNASKSKPILVKTGNTWGYAHQDGSHDPYLPDDSSKTYTVGYTDKDGRFKQLLLSNDRRNGATGINPWDETAIAQEVRRRDAEGTAGMPSIPYTIAPNSEILNNTFNNGLIPLYTDQLKKQKVAEKQSSLNTSNTPRAYEDITTGTSIIMWRYMLNKIHKPKGR